MTDLADLGETHPLEAQQLATLRTLLAGPLQKELRLLLARVAELENDARQVERLASQLPAGLALRGLADGDLASALTPAVEQAIGRALAKHPHLLAGALAYAARHALRHPFKTIGHAAAALFACHRRADGEITRVILIHRATGQIIEEQTRPPDDADQTRQIGRMIKLLIERLREPNQLERYADLGSVRIEGLTYGIHMGPLAMMISIIVGKNAAKALERCDAAIEEIHQTHAVALGTFEGGKAARVLPAGLVQ